MPRASSLAHTASAIVLSFDEWLMNTSCATTILHIQARNCTIAKALRTLARSLSPLTFCHSDKRAERGSRNLLSAYPIYAFLPHLLYTKQLGRKSLHPDCKSA